MSTDRPIKIVGIGDAGIQVLNIVADQRLRGVDYVTVNTNVTSLSASKADQTLLLGTLKTQGIGAGGDPQLGAVATRESADDLYFVLHNAEKIVLVCGFGGGTGTGATPVIVQMLSKLGIETNVVLTQPFTFEGNQRKKVAVAGLKRLEKHTDNLVVIPADRILPFMPSMPALSEVFPLLDQFVMWRVYTELVL